MKNMTPNKTLCNIINARIALEVGHIIKCYKFCFRKQIQLRIIVIIPNAIILNWRTVFVVCNFNIFLF